jgi:hypothetical protein
VLSAREIILGFILPVVIAAAMTLVAGRLRRSWPMALGVAGAFIVTFIGIEGTPGVPPHNVQGWLFYLMMPVSAAAIFYPAARPRWWTQAAIGSPLFALAAWLILRELGQPLSPAEMSGSIVTLAAAMTVWWMLIDRLADASPRAMVPAILAATALAAALCLLNTWQESFAKMAGSLALVLGTMALAGTLFNLPAFRGVWLVVTVILWGLVTLGHYYGDFTWRDLAIIMVAPLCAWIVALPIHLRPSLRAIFATILVLGLLAIPAVPAAIGVYRTMLQETGQN